MKSLFSRIVEEEVKDRLEKERFGQAEQMAQLTDVNEQLKALADHYYAALRLVSQELELLYKMDAPVHTKRRLNQIISCTHSLQGRARSVDEISSYLEQLREIDKGPKMPRD